MSPLKLPLRVLSCREPTVDLDEELMVLDGAYSLDFLSRELLLSAEERLRNYDSIRSYF